MTDFIWKLLILFLFSLPVMAADPYPVITFTCDQSADVIKVKNEVKWGNTGKNFSYSAESGTYNPWEWVEIPPGNTHRIMRKHNKVELSCQLSNGLYKIILQPKLFARDYLAECGKKISVEVTVFRGGAILLDKKPLEEFCRGNAPIIRGVKVFGKSGKVKLYRIAKHRFY